MIAADTSTWIAYFLGEDSVDTQKLLSALESGSLFMPAPVLTELLSSSGLPSDVAAALQALPRLDVSPGFWERAGELRRGVLRRKQKARTLDCLIAQICMDHRSALITRDRDFKNFIADGLTLQ